MALDLSQARVDYRVRDAKAGDVPALAKIHVASWHHAYAGIISPTNLAATTEARSLTRFRGYFVTGGPRRSFLQVLEHAGHGRVVGYINGGRNTAKGLDARGELYELYLLPELQGWGLGRKLMSAGLWRLSGARAMPALLWVLADNHRARRFYVGMRGREFAKGWTQVGDQRLAKVAYRWVDYLPWPEHLV